MENERIDWDSWTKRKKKIIIIKETNNIPVKPFSILYTSDLIRLVFVCCCFAFFFVLRSCQLMSMIPFFIVAVFFLVCDVVCVVICLTIWVSVLFIEYLLFRVNNFAFFDTVFFLFIWLSLSSLLLLFFFLFLLHSSICEPNSTAKFLRFLCFTFLVPLFSFLVVRSRVCVFFVCSFKVGWLAGLFVVCWYTFSLFFFLCSPLFSFFFYFAFVIRCFCVRVRVCWM